MPLIASSNAFSTPFTPAVGAFVVHVTRGAARLQRRPAAGADWVTITDLDDGSAIDLNQSVSGVQYQWIPVPPATSTTATVRADQ